MDAKWSLENFKQDETLVSARLYLSHELVYKVITRFLSKHQRWQLRGEAGGNWYINCDNFATWWTWMIGSPRTKVQDLESRLGIHFLTVYIYMYSNRCMFAVWCMSTETGRVTGLSRYSKFSVCPPGMLPRNPLKDSLWTELLLAAILSIEFTGTSAFKQLC